MFCMNCGANIADGTVYCPNCGSPQQTGQPVAQPGQYNPGAAPNTPYVQTAPPWKTKAIVSLVLGALSVCWAWWGYAAIVGIVLGIVGIVMSINAKKQMEAAGSTECKNLMVWGMILSIVGIVIGAIFFIACGILVGALGAFNRLY
ncbi:MAG: zinc-ribbon domain-containing protein [Clostridiales bacterium]|nr:zinc-ribbon domain-containing protein [Clostridiales bacterium]